MLHVPHQYIERRQLVRIVFFTSTYQDTAVAEVIFCQSLGGILSSLLSRTSDFDFNVGKSVLF